MSDTEIRERFHIPLNIAGHIGVEMPIAKWRQDLAAWVQSFRATNVGAHLITCSDESERENSKSFNEIVSDTILPKLRDSLPSAFRTANLGSRYEWYSIRIAEDHFASFSSDPKLMLVSFCSHSGKFLDEDGRICFGEFHRYGGRSASCGAIGAYLGGSHLPFTIDYEAALSMYGIDRKAMLLNPRVIRDRQKSLYTALAIVGLQTMMLLIDISDYSELTPTMYVITNIVTVNQPGHDNCIVAGVHLVQKTPTGMEVRYVGIGDDPSKYRISEKDGKVSLTRDGGLVDVAQRIDPRETALGHLRDSIEFSPGGKSALRKIKSLLDMHQVPAIRDAGNALLSLLETDTVQALFYFYLIGLLDVHYYEEVVELVHEGRNHLPPNIVSVITNVKDKLTGDQDLLPHCRKLLAVTRKYL